MSKTSECGLCGDPVTIPRQGETVVRGKQGTRVWPGHEIRCLDCLHHPEEVRADD